jgi:hypothetical protein
MTHSPTPWTAEDTDILTVVAFEHWGPRLDDKVNDPPGTVTLRLHPEGGQVRYGDYPDRICEMADDRPEDERIANAAFIVLAVNYHDRLVKALENAAESLRCVYVDYELREGRLLRDTKRDCEKQEAAARALLAEIRAAE